MMTSKMMLGAISLYNAFEPYAEPREEKNNDDDTTETMMPPERQGSAAELSPEYRMDEEGTTEGRMERGEEEEHRDGLPRE